MTSPPLFLFEEKMLILKPNAGKLKTADAGVNFYASAWLENNEVTTFVHGLGGSPDMVKLWYDDNGTVLCLDDSNISSTTSTNINLDFAGLTIDDTHKVKIIAYRI
jgi:hypothetical protein